MIIILLKNKKYVVSLYKNETKLLYGIPKSFYTHRHEPTSVLPVCMCENTVILTTQNYNRLEYNYACLDDSQSEEFLTSEGC